jgi:hypothetical protein
MLRKGCHPAITPVSMRNVGKRRQKSRQAWPRRHFSGGLLNVQRNGLAHMPETSPDPPFSPHFWLFSQPSPLTIFCHFAENPASIC